MNSNNAELTDEEKEVMDNLFMSADSGMEEFNMKVNPPRHSYTEQLLLRIATWIELCSFFEFEKEISRRVVGQPELRTVLTIVYSYLKAVADNRRIDHNMIISAPSGCGKTETYRALRDYFSKMIPELPVYIYDVSQVTATGYKGNDVSEIIEAFKARKIRQAIGLVFLDEFDKKLEPSYARGINVNREAQANLLTLVEGSEVGMVDTNYTMFIGLGSFSSLREKDAHVKNPIGLGNDTEWKNVTENKCHYKKLTRDDLIRSGGSHELVGRFPYIFNYQPLSEEGTRAVIEKIKSDVIDSMSIESLELSDAAISLLMESANTEFGCRIIATKLRELLIDKYQEALMYAPDNKSILKMSVDKNLKTTYEWRVDENAVRIVELE